MKSISNLIMTVGAILLTPIYRVFPKKKYDCIIYFDGHLGDYFLCHECFTQMASQGKRVLLITNVCFDEKLNHIYDVFADVVFIRRMKQAFSIPFRVSCRFYLFTGCCSNAIDRILTQLLSAKEKTKFMWFSENKPDWRLKLDNSAFHRVIPPFPVNEHLSYQISDAIKQAFHVDVVPKIPDFRSYIGQSPVKEPYFVLNAGVASVRQRSWPLDRFAQLTDYCANRTGLKCVFVGTKDDTDNGNELKNLCNCEIVNLAGKTTLSELLTVIGNAAFVIGNDTGTTHIAAACRINGFSVLSDFAGDMFLPYPDALCKDVIVGVVRQNTDCRGCVIKKPFIPDCIRQDGCLTRIKCVDSITVRDAMEALEKTEILDRIR